MTTSDRAREDLITLPREVAARVREALKPFARADHIIASFDGDRLRCILTYPADEHGKTFKLASIDEARQALALLAEQGDPT